MMRDTMESATEKASLATAKRLSMALAETGWTNCNVLRSLVMWRKLCEIAQQTNKDRFRDLKFYLSIPLHAILQGQPAQRFLNEVEPLLRNIVASTNVGNEVSHASAKKLGDLISFERFRTLLRELLQYYPEMKVFDPLIMDQSNWAAFIIGYIQMIAEFRTLVRIKATDNDPIEAYLDPPLVPEDQPDSLAWNWHFTLNDTPDKTIVHLRHLLKIASLFESSQADIEPDGLGKAG